MELEKLCLYCEHWYFDGGSSYDSEYKSEYGASMGCHRGHWGDKEMINIYTTDEFRSLLEKGLTCTDYTKVEMPYVR